MNIFWLDYDLQKCVESYFDKYVVKMPLETAQILCTTVNFYGGNAPYKSTHINHPCCIWARESRKNYIWLCELGCRICQEYCYRYNKIHKCLDIIKYCIDTIPPITKLEFTRIPLCMPDIYKTNDPIISYRNYLLGEKRHLAQWKNRSVPDWWK